MSFKSQNIKINHVCKKLLTDSTVETVIGFRQGGTEDLAIPYIFSDPDGADNLVWNNRCVPNLAQYLMGRTGKVAVVAKPCDVRAIVSLVLENQLSRDNIHIVGVPCDGMVDSEGNPLHGCLDCRVNMPPVYDICIEDSEVEPKKAVDSALEQKLEESLERFQNEMDKCILCFSCRQACYGCYCKTCFMDRGVPNWQPAKPDTGAKMLYHLGRAMHLAGRCVECGACENACASGVDIRYLIKEVSNFVDEMYGYRTGLDLEAQPVMLTYNTNDREVGFLGGDAHGE